MTDSQQKMWQKVDQQREVYVGFLQELLRSSQGGEGATQQFVADKFNDLGCEVEVIRYAPQTIFARQQCAHPIAVDPVERVCVVGQRAGADGGRSILFWAHPDSVPVAGTEAWQHAPFAGEIENGRLYGWGVSDDLAGVAIMTCALEAVLATGLKPKGEVILASTPSKGRAKGILAVLDRGYMADASIYLHPAETELGLKDIKSFASGQLVFCVTVSGRPPDTTEPTHTVFYHLAVDPIDKAWVIYQALRTLGAKRASEVYHPVLAKAIGCSTNLHIAYIRGGNESELHLVSPECVLAGTVTFPPGEKMADVQVQITQAVQTAADGDDWLKEHRPQLEWLYGTNGIEVSAQHPIYQTACRAIAAVTGSEPNVNPLHTASDIRNPILQRGIPTVGFGPLAGDSTQIGGHDEWVDVEDYLRTVKIVGSIILDWCGV